MRSMRAVAALRVLVVVVLALLAAVAGRSPAVATTTDLSPVTVREAAVAAGGLVTVPALDGREVTSAPQMLTVPGSDASAFTLTDQTGHEIAFTGSPTADGVRLPRLLPGVYEFTAPEGTARFMVAGAGAEYAEPGWDFTAPPPVWPAYVFGAGVLLLGGALLLRRRWALAAFPLVLGVGVIAGGYVVSGMTGIEPMTVSECTPGNARLTDTSAACALKRVTWVMATKDVDAAIAEIGEIPGCHDWAHEVGRRSIILTEDLQSLVHPASPVCTEGLFHGMMYGSAMYLTDAEYRAFLDGFCDRVKTDDRGFSMGSCAHGVGHGWVMRTNARLADAQEECRLAFGMDPADQFLYDECLGATVWEYTATYTSAAGLAEWMPQDAVAPKEICERTEARQAGWCYSALVAATPLEGMWPFRDAAKDAVVSCAPIEDPVRRESCIRGVVRIVLNLVGPDPQEATVCRALEAEFDARICVQAFTYHNAYHRLSNIDAPEICKVTGFPREDCFTWGTLPPMLENRVGPDGIAPPPDGMQTPRNDSRNVPPPGEEIVPVSPFGMRS